MLIVDGSISRLDVPKGTVLGSLLLVVYINSVDTVDYKMMTLSYQLVFNEDMTVSIALHHNVLCTFQVKVIVIDDSLAVVYQDGVKFDSDLPEFK